MTRAHKAVDYAIKQGKKLEEVVPRNTVQARPRKTTPYSARQCEELGSGPSLAAQVRDTWEEIVDRKKPPRRAFPHLSAAEAKTGRATIPIDNISTMHIIEV